ncbi:hypothetical protein [Agrococcus sp. ARC_14]|uniref:hypothetical protein n=1 Tax=Agrococcus sp. ARC_14 TaxID=2919927 RepID=UPI001F052A62|nr:hypothetical protein [Agrococcus sp. ARC_14]MCH1881886.1 hypothetical protein [Agrococcus sp. ARC_14]
MSRARAVAAAILVLVAVTGCGPTGALAPSEPLVTAQPTTTQSTERQSTEPSTIRSTERPASPEPVATTEPPLASAAPPATEPPVTELPHWEAQTLDAVSVGGAPVEPGAMFDLAMACDPAYPTWLHEPGSTPTPRTTDGRSFWCEEGIAVVMAAGVPGETAQPFAMLEDDLAAPVIERVPAGSGFGSDAVQRLTDRLGVPTVRVSASCGVVGPQLSLGDQTLSCVEQYSEVSFEPVPLDEALRALVLPAGFAGTVWMRPVE